MKILVQDNFFDDPDLIRGMGLSHDSYKINHNFIFNPSSSPGWRGQRSTELSELNNNVLNYYSKLIFDLCDEFFNFDVNLNNLNSESLKFVISTYFHITTEETKNAYADWQDKYHRDFNTLFAGVVYLTPNAPLNAGTSFIDPHKNQFINIENKYNRLVAYEGKIVHGVSDVFGNSIETGRMTYTFFISSFEEN